MTKIAPACCAALALAVSSAAHCETASYRPPSRPSSYAPQEHSAQHVYGAPIETPIVGRARTVPRNNKSTGHSARPPARTAPEHRANAPRTKPKTSHPAARKP